MFPPISCHPCVTVMPVVSCHPCITVPPGACPTTTPACVASGGFVCNPTITIFTTPQTPQLTIQQGGNPGQAGAPRTGMFNPFG
ncbi:MAG TPA: hypothetical protein VK665_17650 [Candidatus Elarobacter sp.]|nr:hypothetical protein [Candidatus Elarobacter sp.]